MTARPYPAFEGTTGMRTKRQHEEPENPDRWVVSYADFITLLFAFFTTLYAISHVALGHLRQFTGSLQTAFRASDVRPGATPVIEGVRPLSVADSQFEQQIREALQKFDIIEGIVITRDDRGIIVSLMDPLLFDPGASDPRQEARPVLAAVASLAQRSGRRISIEGHTDNIPLAASRYRSNLELSAARAAGVFAVLHDESPPLADRMSIAGYGEYRPVVSNTTPEGRIRNRRVDILFVSGSDHTETGR